ncbi:MAG: hypothetical protein OEL91_02410 [Burkholderiaceae bacterium]|nr:hypothetical protein [Burkholderiaceae bacterium]
MHIRIVAAIGGGGQTAQRYFLRTPFHRAGRLEYVRDGDALKGNRETKQK